MESFRDKNVFITGHTGFKGGWLSLWLHKAGARVTGYALPPEHPKGIFEAATIQDKCHHLIGDIRDTDRLSEAVMDAKPDIIFHLAAQPLVLESFKTPKETFDTNVIGTINLLEAARKVPSVKAIVVITSDKCYANDNLGRAFVEGDPLGGHDPYSGSKAACEMAVNSYYQSFFKKEGIGVASVRAGNVIGGGDWATDRILPDCYRSLLKGEEIQVRNPKAVRPWQHVLEPLSGYLKLAERLLEEPEKFSSPWNFGPDTEAQIPVEKLVELVTKSWEGGSWQHQSQSEAPQEAKFLHLDISKAKGQLGWHPRLSIDEAVNLTTAWYRHSAVDDTFCLGQIEEYLTYKQ